MRDYKHYGGNDRRYGRAALALVVLIVAMGVAGYVDNQRPVPAEVSEPVKSATQVQIEKILPPAPAAAIAKHARYPKTMAAIAHTESRGNHRAVGDRGKSLGMFQVQPHHWGDVALDDLEQQVRQADQVFFHLVQEYGYREAVRRWNGDGPASRRYQKIVLAKVARLND